MIATIDIDKKQYQIDLHKPIDLAIPISPKKGASAWYVDLPKITPVKTEQFNGSVKDGGSVNFRNVFFNPHGNGTHTESVGHITKEVYSVHNIFDRFFFVANLITIDPIKVNGDLIITKDLLLKQLGNDQPEALLIRTLPNGIDKKTRNYSNSNPAYFDEESMKFIVEKGIKHLLVDLPSVDREEDGGNLATHHIFWNYPEEINLKKTITELIFVDDSVKDGKYILNLQIASIENDASPSRPVLYSLQEIE